MRKKIIVITLFFLLVFTAIGIIDQEPGNPPGDGMDDDWELEHGLDNETDDTLEDPDEDNLINIQEYILGCHPQKNDTDGDGYKDWVEFQYQTNCSKASDYPTTSIINISLVNPKFGVARVSTFNFSIETDYLSKCKYTTNPEKNYSEIEQPSNFFSSETEDEFRYKHSIEEFNLEDFPDNHEVEIYIVCLSEEVNHIEDDYYTNDEFPKEIILSVDRSKPILESVKAIPNPVIESLRVDLEVETDDKTICRFIEPSEFNEDPDDYLEWFEDHPKSEYKTTSTLTLTSSTTPGIEDEKTYKYLVQCQNLAFAFTDPDNVTFSVNLSAPEKITELLPEGVIEGKDAKLEVWTNKDSTCYVGEGYNDLFPQMDAKYHFLEEGNLSEGIKTYPVKCIFDNLEHVEDEIRFIVDVTKPSLPVINADTETCSVNSLNAWFNSSDSLGIKGYYYRILDSASSVILNYTFTEDNVKNLTGLNLARGSKYYWEVYAIDVANNEGSARKSTGTTILGETDDLCMENQPPYLNVTPVFTELGIDVSLSCYDSDLGGSCNSIKYRLSDDCECDNCSYNSYTTSTNIIIKNETNLCYKITDNRNLSVENYVEFKFKACSSNTDNCCLDQETEICSPSCETITNVDCNADLLDTDNDGIPDIKETECGLDLNDDSDANIDTDGDGLSNKLECLNYGTDINKADSDGDGVDDKTEISKGSDPMNPDDFPIDPNKDTDGDGIPDIKETECGLDLNDPSDANADNDGDTLTNKRECLTFRTNINKKDSDGDGVEDNVEIDKDTDPNDSSEFPESHILNIILFVFGLGALIGGVFMFAQDNMGKPKNVKIPKQAANKPLINFNQTKKDMSKEAKQLTEPQTQTQSQPQMPAKLNQKSDLSAIDKEIMKKKRLLKLKKMDSIFDEFADDTEVRKIKEPKVRARPRLNLTLNPKPSKSVKEQEDTFERLEDISKEGAFEELEVIKKKDKKKR